MSDQSSGVLEPGSKADRLTGLVAAVYGVAILCLAVIGAVLIFRGAPITEANAVLRLAGVFTLWAVATVAIVLFESLRKRLTRRQNV